MGLDGEQGFNATSTKERFHRSREVEVVDIERISNNSSDFIAGLVGSTAARGGRVRRRRARAIGLRLG